MPSLKILDENDLDLLVPKEFNSLSDSNDSNIEGILLINDDDLLNLAIVEKQRKDSDYRSDEQYDRCSKDYMKYLMQSAANPERLSMSEFMSSWEDKTDSNWHGKIYRQLDAFVSKDKIDENSTVWGGVELEILNEKAVILKLIMLHDSIQRGTGIGASWYDNHIIPFARSKGFEYIVGIPIADKKSGIDQRPYWIKRGQRPAITMPLDFLNRTGIPRGMYFQSVKA